MTKKTDTAKKALTTTNSAVAAKTQKSNKTPKKAIQFDYMLLRERIRLKFGTSKALCEHLSWNRRTFSQKLNNYLEFTSSELVMLIQALEIKSRDIDKFLFTVIRHSK